MKEEIIAECDGSDYIKCCRYEQSFEYLEGQGNKSLYPNHDGSHFGAIIFTSKKFPQGKVKITIETIEKAK